MRIYLCKKCKGKDGSQPCLLTVDDDEDYPIHCPYSGKDDDAKFKQVFPKIKKDEK